MQKTINGHPSGKILFLMFFLGLALLGGVIERVERDLYGVKPGVFLEDIDFSCYLPREIMPILEETAAKSQTFPLEPSIDKNGRIIPGANGTTLDVETTMDKLLSAPKGRRIKPVYLETPPVHKESELEAINKVIGRYATSDEGFGARKHNMNLACQAIDFSVVWPGTIFSFNQVVGPTTASHGYYPAPVMLDEELVPGVGGGVCQVATTLYNAVRMAHLPVVERHVHSGKVYYVPDGLDAAIAYDYLDFKFKNNKKYPIVIRGHISSGRVNMEILGR